MRRAQRWRFGFLSLALAAILAGCNGAETGGGGASPATRPFDADSEPNSAAKKLMVAHGCLRCHRVGGAGDATPDRAPDLGSAGRDPEHTAAWIEKKIRDPFAAKPDSLMPPYEDRMEDREIRQIAEYLATLR